MTTCIHCEQKCRLTTGKEVYPHRPDLHFKQIWVCDPCNARVGCHGETDKALGFAANAELRNARIKLHNDRLDKLWKHADQLNCYAPEDKKSLRKIRSRARRRVYHFLSVQMGLSPDQTHTGMFNLEQCREAWTALKGQTPCSIREWAKQEEQSA